MDQRQEQFLQACFSRKEDSRLALEACDGMELDAAMVRILPFVYHRWKGFASNELVAAGHRAYLTTWRQNRERMTAVREFLMSLRKEGVECMLLKGAALTLRNYRDYGLRSMGDFDVLIRPWDVERTLKLMLGGGWRAQGDRSVESIIRQSRARHAWQFLRNETEHCDLHWRPLARSSAPGVTEKFWQGAEDADLDGLTVKVPCGTDQFFHTCVHAMHGEGTPNLYWFADALMLLSEGGIDWARASELARESRMSVRFSEALTALRSRFEVTTGEVGGTDDDWQQPEFALLQKACPLSGWDSVQWHLYNFRRLRLNDSGWREAPFLAAFPDYLRVFMDAPTLPGMLKRVWSEFWRGSKVFT